MNAVMEIASKTICSARCPHCGALNTFPERELSLRALHGRNYRNWFSPTANVRDRYDHLYSLDELEPWIGRVKSIAEDAQDTYVVTNNHNLGKSTVNALQLKAFLSGRPVEAPPTLQDASV